MDKVLEGAIRQFYPNARPLDARENHCIHGPENCRECAAIPMPKQREAYGDLMPKPDGDWDTPECRKAATDAYEKLASKPEGYQDPKWKVVHDAAEALHNIDHPPDADTLILEANLRRMTKDLRRQLADVTQAMPVASEDRKNVPLCTGVLDYFPAAMVAVAQLSKAGNDKHNPGEPLHHSRAKSSDHADCILRHLADRGLVDPEDNIRHSVKVAWRALALAQEELEAAGAPKARGAK